MSPQEITLIIADDQQVFAEGLKTIFGYGAPEIRVAGTARNGAEAVEMVRKNPPDIVLLDVRMPVLDGVEAAKQIHEIAPQVRIVMLTTFDDDEYVKMSLSYGAIGYLLKDRPPDELIASLRAVRGGILQIDPAVSRSLILDVRARDVDGDEFLKRLFSLTPRERDVLKLLVEAKDNRQIADAIGIAEQTARSYVSTLYSKLGFANRLEVMKKMESIRFYLEHSYTPRR